MRLKGDILAQCGPQLSSLAITHPSRTGPGARRTGRTPSPRSSGLYGAYYQSARAPAPRPADAIIRGENTGSNQGDNITLKERSSLSRALSVLAASRGSSSAVRCQVRASRPANGRQADATSYCQLARGGSRRRLPVQLPVPSCRSRQKAQNWLAPLVGRLSNSKIEQSEPVN